MDRLNQPYNWLIPSPDNHSVGNTTITSLECELFPGCLQHKKAINLVFLPWFTRILKGGEPS